jgi:cell shape-determining protein MreC
MSYLLDKKIKRQKYFKIALGLVLLIFLFYFRAGIFDGFSYIAQEVFRPVLVVGRDLGEKFSNLKAYFISKSSLYAENQNLQSEVAFNDARMANYNSVLTDDANLKSILNRINPKTNMILSAILAKPNQSLYDTLIIDAGSAQGIKVGDTVFAEGNLPIGRIAEGYPDSSKVILFSNPGKQTEVVVEKQVSSSIDASGNLPAVRQGVFVQLIGRGGGNFEMDMPKDFTLTPGDQMVLPGINSYLMAITQKIISDPRDPMTKALLTSPVNVQELKFVEVEE